MLFILTGDIQIGKTRWLSALIESLEAQGVTCAGVLAPGVWREVPGERPDEVSYEKYGIDNLMLPGGERVALSRLDRPVEKPRKLSAEEREAMFQRPAAHQAQEVKSHWNMSKAAFAAVDEHFEQLRHRAEAVLRSVAQVEESQVANAQPESAHVQPEELPIEGVQPTEVAVRPGVLVVDELGRLELLCGEGLKQAMSLLHMGPTPLWPNAIVVVRDILVETARELLSPAWPEIALVSPDDESRTRIIHEALKAL